MQSIIIFFKHLVSLVESITTITVMVGFINLVIIIIKGISPVCYRLGLGLSKRRIAIFAEEGYTELKNLLINSKIFKEKNIIQIDRRSIKRAENETIFLIYWKDFDKNLDEIINLVKNTTALIIYAPRQDGLIDDASMEKINAESNAVVVNFRGRLLNDILTSMITSSFKS